jgi:hydroxymethylbilane synthase
MLSLLAAIDDPGARATTTAERAFLETLGSGCAAPVAAHAEVVAGGAADSSNSLLQGVMRSRMDGLVAAIDACEVVRVRGEGEPEELGARLAREALAAGADRILAAIRG